MKAKNPTTGNLEEIYIKGIDNLPVGTEIDIDDNTPVPDGWVEVDNPERINRTLVPKGTKIVANSNLNTIDFLKVGKYYCSYNSAATSLSNCPTNLGFMMEVFSVLTDQIDDETTGTWVYRTRRILNLNGDVFYQQCWSNDNKVWTYERWKKVTMTNV